MSPHKILVELMRSHPIIRVYEAIFSMDFVTKLGNVVFRFYHIDEEKHEIVFFASPLPMQDFFTMSDDRVKELYITIFNEAHRRFKIQDVGEE